MILKAPDRHISMAAIFLSMGKRAKGMREFLTKGFFGAILGLCIGTSASASIISRSFLDEALTDYATNTALDLKANQSDFTDLSNKIGRLPSGDMDGLRQASKAFLFGSEATMLPSSMEELIKILFVFDEFLPAFEQIISGYYPNYESPQIMGLYPLTNAVKQIGTLPSGDMDGLRQASKAFLFGSEATMLPSSMEELIKILFVFDEFLPAFEQIISGYYPNYESPQIMGLYPLTNAVKQIGTLPSGDISISKGLRALVPGTEYIYPKSIGVFIEEMYSGNIGLSSLAQSVFYGNEIMGQTNTALQVKGLLQITHEIGTLPSGSLLGTNQAINAFYKDMNQTETPTYPRNLGETIHQIYQTLFPAIVTRINSVSNTANSARSVADANTAKIGDLPTEYATVGAALTAMDAKIDARELPSSSDDGQYVLSAKKVGDTITYTWVKMDLTSEEQAQ